MNYCILAHADGSCIKSGKPVSLHEILGKKILSYVLDSVRRAEKKHSGRVLIVTDMGDSVKSLTNEEEIINVPSSFFNEDDLVKALCSYVGELNPAVIIEADTLITNQEAFEDIIESNKAEVFSLASKFAAQSDELIKVSNRYDLYRVSEVFRKQINLHHMDEGVTIVDPLRTYIGPEVSIGIDTIIYPDVSITGATVIGQGCVIGSNTEIFSSAIGNGVSINKSVILESTIGDLTTVGPFAYIRPHNHIGRHCRIGDFVELKNSNIGNETKVSHLTYVGDADVGSGVNFGCGTVTVNYDGVKKHRTTIEDGAFVGCNTNLVAPVKLGRNAYTAAGSTITKDVEPEALAIARARQDNKQSWRIKRFRK